MRHDYNYRHFNAGWRTLTAFPGPRAGELARDFVVYTTDGEVVALSDFRGQWLVVETGSLTCPMFARNVKPMNALAKKHSDVTFLVLYVRETHPGSKIGPHRDLAEKVRRAREAAEKYGDRRKFVVDDLDGRVHQAYGGFPNMVYVISPEGRIVWRCDWMTPAKLKDVLDHRTRVHPEEHLDPGLPVFASTLGGLWLGGWDAAWDFFRVLPELLRQHFQANLISSRQGRLPTG
jgi:hypothetical protein